MVVYYVIKNQIIESEKLLSSSFFKYVPFKISRDYHYFKYSTVQLELEALSSFIMMDEKILKNDVTLSDDIINTIQRLNS